MTCSLKKIKLELEKTSKLNQLCCVENTIEISTVLELHTPVVIRVIFPCNLHAEQLLVAERCSHWLGRASDLSSFFINITL